MVLTYAGAEPEEAAVTSSCGLQSVTLRPLSAHMLAVSKQLGIMTYSAVSSHVQHHQVDQLFTGGVMNSRRICSDLSDLLQHMYDSHVSEVHSLNSCPLLLQILLTRLGPDLQNSLMYQEGIDGCTEPPQGSSVKVTLSTQSQALQVTLTQTLY